MRPTRLVAVLLVCVAACVAPDGEEAGPDADVPDEVVVEEPPALESAVLVGTDNPFGVMSGAAYANTWRSNTGGQNVWRTIPQMSAVAYARAGDQLEVDVSADIASSSLASISLRVLVDGVVAAPNDVVFRSGASNHIRSFRFVQGNMTAGRHVVEVQWKGDPLATITDHQVTTRTAAPSSGEARLITTWLADSLSTTSSSAWSDLNGMWLLANHSVARDMVITGSFEAESATGSVRVRALVDGVQVGDSYLLPPATARGARSVVYHVSNIAAGLHSVSFQWASDGGTARLWDRSLTVHSAPWLGDRGGLSGQTTFANTTLYDATWTMLTDHTVYTYAPNETSTITLSTEAYTINGGQLYARVLVDGLPAQPGDVMVTDANNGWQTHTLTFQHKNVVAGTHHYRVELSVAGSSPSRRAFIRDRNLAIVHNQRHGVDFASVSPLTTNGPPQQPRRGTYRVVTFCFDPQNPNDPPGGPLTTEQLLHTFIGGDGHKNVYDWYQENTGGQIAMTLNALVVPPTGPSCYQPPCPDPMNTETCHTGGWYWRNMVPGVDWEHQPQAFKDDIVQMQVDAFAAADADLHFHGYDTNGDGAVSSDEAVIVIAKPQGSTFGQATGGAFTLDGSSMNLDFIDAYLPPDDADPDNDRTKRVGTLVHEIAHAILGADDMYGDEASGAAYTVMGNHEPAGHLDPAHKLANGLLTPTAIEMETLATDTPVAVPAVEASGEALLLYSRTRPWEVFLVENRWADASNQDGFETAGTGTGPTSAIVIWHVNLWTLALDPSTTNVYYRRLPQSLPQEAQRSCLRYFDGTTAPIAVVRGDGPNGASVGITLSRLANPSSCTDIFGSGGIGGIGG